jgi:DNA-binding MarR family transcriptional regulator/GNAT superfamily N-acetyltransferase
MAAPARTFPASSSNDPIQAVRRFNRFYTRQIGVLQEHLVQSRFSLTEVRVLYELAHREHGTAGELCQDLGLDRGYLSRMLQSFETQGLIKTAASKDDRRKVLLSLTASGRKMLAPLERRSSDEVAAMLSKLAPAQQEKLLLAMRDIERLLVQEKVQEKVRQEAQQGPLSQAGPAYILRSHRPGDMGWVVQRHGALYWQEYHYDERFEALVAGIVAEFVENLDTKRERCWIAEKTPAEKDGENVGSVFIVRKSKTVAKLRLLLVEPSARGLGIGRRLVEECVRFAHRVGYKKMELWTQGELHAARHLYEQAGFKLVDKKRHDSFGRKGLVAETWELKL